MVVPHHVLELPVGKVGHPYVADLVITSSDSESRSQTSVSLIECKKNVSSDANNVNILPLYLVHLWGYH